MKKLKRILAMLGVVVIAGLYVATFVTALLAAPGSTELFKTSIIATIMIPILIYVVLFIYRLIHPDSDEES